MDARQRRDLRGRHRRRLPDGPRRLRAGLAGGLFRTNDGGATWKTLDTGTTARPLELTAPTTSTVILAGPTGLRRSTDSGNTFSAVKGDVAKAKLDAIDRAGSALVRLGLA